MQPVPYRGASYSAKDGAFLAWWRAHMPAARFGEARAAYDAAQDKTKWPFSAAHRE